MNILSHSRKALSLILLVSVSATFPMSWVKKGANWVKAHTPSTATIASYVPSKEAIASSLPSMKTIKDVAAREAQRAQGNAEAIKNVLPANTAPIVLGTVGVLGAGYILSKTYNYFNVPSAPVEPIVDPRQVQVENVILEGLMDIAKHTNQEPAQPVVNENHVQEQMNALAEKPNAENGVASNKENAEEAYNAVIEEIKKLSKKKEHTSVNHVVIGSDTMLHRAVKNGDISEVKRILNKLTTFKDRYVALHGNTNAQGKSVMVLANDLQSKSTEHAEIAGLIFVESGKAD